MASRSLGTLTLDLVAKIGGFERGLDKASRTTDKRMREIEARAKKMGVALGTALAAAATAAFVGLVAVTKQAIDSADAMRDMSIRIGISTEVLSAYGYTAQQTGTDIDTLGKGLKILAKNAADAINPTSEQSKVFKALGVEVTDATGKLRGLDTLVPEIADKFKVLGDGTTKAALAQALFGRAGLELTEFLNQGAEGLDDFAQKAAALGIILDGQTAAAADDFNDQLADLKTLAAGLGLQVAKELLPELSKLVLWAKEFVTEGDNAAEIAHDIGDGFRDMVSVAESIGTLIGWLESLRLKMAELEKSSPGWKLRQAIIGALPADFSEVAGQANTKSPLFSGVTGGANTVSETDADLARKLALALSNPTATGKTGKSEAEKQAEKVARAIEQMTKAQQDWQNELTKTGNPIADEYASRLREITEQAKGFAEEGVPAEKVKAFTDEMERLATSLRDSDIAEFQKEFNEASDQMAASMQGPMKQALLDYQIQVKEIDDLLKLGIITLDEYNARLGLLTQQRDSPATGMLDAINEEIMLLGMSSDQQEIYNRLKFAGVDAESKWTPAIIAATKELQRQREVMGDQIELMDGLRDSAKGFLDDLREGVGVWDSLKNAADNFADVLWEMAANKLIDQLFGKQGEPAGGSAGGWFQSLLGAFLGGGRAGGGSVMPGKLYEVGEHDRPEMLMSGGRQYLIPGNAGNVKPMSGGGGSGFNQTNVFQFAAPTSLTTQKQAAVRVGLEAQMAIARNSG